MTLGHLCLVLTLLGALQTQAKDSDPSFIPAPSFATIPLQEDFQDDKFQGKWYLVGVAGNEFWKEIHSGIKMDSTTYKLEADHSYNVTVMHLSDTCCEHWIGSLAPGSRPGQFNLVNIQSFRKLRRYTMQVVATDYDDFAFVFSKKTLGNTEYFKIRLYGRKKDVQGPLLKAVFIVYARSLGLTDDNIIFPVPIDECIDD